MDTNKVMLLILDGWGIGADPKRSAIDQANTPVYHMLLDQYPHATLLTHGEYVGLPEGQMGNSEVGHINIGAGRVIYQELARINKAVRLRELHEDKILLDAIKSAKSRKAKIHLLGLVSDGGVHSHINHLLALCDILNEQNCPNTFIHAFTDGRDTDPKSGVDFISTVLDHIANTPIKLATLIGRYYAMDRDNRWERTQKAYDLLIKGKGHDSSDIIKTLNDYYAEGKTDEFIEPTVIDKDGIIQPNDLVIFFNFRTDRPRQITKVMTQTSIHGYDMRPIDLDFISFTRYDEEFVGIDVLYEKDSVANGLGETVANNNLKQLRIAETEKYPHVTFFFSGGKEEPLVGEERIMVPSPKVATYDLQPDMSAQEITNKLLAYVKKEHPDFVCLNFANTDMVGHTGVFSAAITAAETVDRCLGEIVDYALPEGYHLIVIADHGNSDYMINDNGTPNTAHTTNPVPIIYVAEGVTKSTLIHNGILADVAPTILKIMKIDQPIEMTGKSLLIN